VAEEQEDMGSSGPQIAEAMGETVGVGKDEISEFIDWHGATTLSAGGGIGAEAPSMGRGEPRGLGLADVAIGAEHCDARR
jgi:hypothetical protein